MNIQITLLVRSRAAAREFVAGDLDTFSDMDLMDHRHSFSWEAS